MDTSPEEVVISYYSPGEITAMVPSESRWGKGRRGTWNHVRSLDSMAGKASTGYHWDCSEDCSQVM